MPQTKTTIQFNSDASAALDNLSEALQTTKAEVLRSALSLYIYIVNNLRNESRSLAVVSENGGKTNVEKIIAVPGLLPLAQNRPRA